MPSLHGFMPGYGRIGVEFGSDVGRTLETVRKTYMKPSRLRDDVVKQMNTTTQLLAVALAALIAFTGFAAAGAAGFGTSIAAENTTDDPIVANESVTADRALDGSNSPWVTGDDRLDRFQDRFNLTADQVETIRSDVTDLIDSGAEPVTVRDRVATLLETYGVEDPTLGPSAETAVGVGPYGQGQGASQSDGTRLGQGNGMSGNGGPHGPADGSCLA